MWGRYWHWFFKALLHLRSCSFMPNGRTHGRRHQLLPPTQLLNPKILNLDSLGQSFLMSNSVFSHQQISSAAEVTPFMGRSTWKPVSLQCLMDLRFKFDLIHLHALNMCYIVQWAPFSVLYNLLPMNRTFSWFWKVVLSNNSPEFLKVF